MFRLSTLSTAETDGVDYQIGDLSLYPEILDDDKSLYTANNNAETHLKQSLTYNGKYIITEDASEFPPYGILRIGNKENPGDSNYELIYYDRRNSTTFMDLMRGFAGSLQNTWKNGSYVSNSVMAESHNAVKDAVIKVEQNLGLSEFPDEDSLNGILKGLEHKFLAPTPAFRAFPLSGPPTLTVKFQNFSNTQAIRFLWDFGDGTTSAERNPTHVYQNEGIFTVRLNMIMTTGAQGVTVKTNYITVSEKEVVPFFYVSLQDLTNDAPATYLFVDQTDGDILARYWVFGDGENESIIDPNDHTIEHTYASAGTYNPSLLIVFRDQSLKRFFLQEGITVI